MSGRAVSAPVCTLHLALSGPHSRKGNAIHIVLDTNQFLQFESADCRREFGVNFAGVTLPPLVYAEIILRRNPRRSLNWLKSFSVRLGWTRGEVIRAITEGSESEISELRPFVSEVILKAASGNLFNPTQELRTWARDAKDRNLKFLSGMRQATREFRRLLRNLTAQGAAPPKTKFKDLEDALLHVGQGPDSFLGSLILPVDGKGNPKPTACSSPETLFSAVMENQFLRRWFLSLVCYTMGVAEAWENEEYNINPGLKRDDATDVTIPLYAANGDCIVTRDKMLQRIVSMVEPACRVSTLHFK